MSAATETDERLDWIAEVIPSTHFERLARIAHAFEAKQGEKVDRFRFIYQPWGELVQEIGTGTHGPAYFLSSLLTILVDNAEAGRINGPVYAFRSYMRATARTLHAEFKERGIAR